jgi:hypothetical protein
MVLSSRRRQPRRGIILLVVLALITLFASIGVAFVYFSEEEVTKAADQKAAEVIKLPDADLMFNYVMRQVIFPTNDNNSVLFTHSLLENMYGRSAAGVSSIAPYNGIGWRSNTANVPAGQDNLFRRNLQGQQYDELTHGSLNPTYTYPDHKNPYLGAVSANWTVRNFPFVNPASYTQHGPVAIARSFAREMKFRVQIRNSTTGTIVGVREVAINPFANDRSHRPFWTNTTGPNFVLPLTITDIPILTAPLEYVPNVTIQMANTTGAGAQLVLTPADCRAHSMRPTPRLNPNFPPPPDLGGDVKNLPPEVKTLVGFDGNNNPVFANNDSFWMDFGFPALPYSKTKKIKPLVAMFIMDNDGKVNLSHAGNLRGLDYDPILNVPLSYHVSGHGMGPWEINPTRMGIPLAELRQLKAGIVAGNTYVRGSYGFDNNYDPSMQGSSNGYFPLLRGAPYYSAINVDGTTDGFGPANRPYMPSNPWQLRGDIISATDPTYRRFPFHNNPNSPTGPAPYYHGLSGFSNGSEGEYLRPLLSPYIPLVGPQPRAFKSPLYVPPFALNQVSSNVASTGFNSAFRSFPASNQEALYRTRDTGTDKIDSELRKLMPNTFSNPSLRWQLTTMSSDLNYMGIAPGWYGGIPQELVRPDVSGIARPSLPQREPGALPIAGTYEQPPTAFPNLRHGGYLPPVAGSTDNTFPNGPTTLAYPMSPYPAYLAHGVNGEYQAQIPVPAAPPAAPPTFPTQVFWRSIFGNASRIDLARQLPDYPLPVDNNSHLDMTNTLVRSAYKIALQSRQRFALELYHAMENLMHPANLDARRYIAQLAVNMVDYIDNDDYPTWFSIPQATAPIDSTKIVWGTELPRLLINEVYSEAVNSDGDPLTGNQAQEDYDVNNWVELYNPLETGSHTAWADGANARLHVNNTSVYRLLVTNRVNATNLRQSGNTIGYPNSTTIGNNLKVVNFPPNITVAPSDQNYGNGANATNPGFYLVGPTPPPYQTTPGAVTAPDPLNFPTPDLVTNNMVLTRTINSNNPIQTAMPDQNPVIILQRLANPYLPHQIVDAATTMSSDVTDPTAVFYNPYITIDYVINHKVNNAAQYNRSGNPDDQNPDPDNPGTAGPGPQNRVSIGKMQPYAGLNDYSIDATTSVVTHNTVWTNQSADRDAATAGLQRLQGQPQHTFLRHNAIETDRRTDMAAMTVPNPSPDASGVAAANTLRVPFDWLVHLDRMPTSPVDLLHVSGYKPHELTQQFNQTTNRDTLVLEPAGGGPAAPNYNLNTLASTIRLRTSAANPFLGTWFGVPFKVKVGDMVSATFAADATGATTRQALVRVIAIDLTANEWIDVVTGNVGTVHNPTAPNPNPNTAQVVVPFAHYAPWYRAQQLVNATTIPTPFPYSQSSGALYRLLEAVAVRNPGMDVGQIRFSSTTANNIIPNAGDSRWLQLDSGTIVATGQQIPNVRNSRIVTTNDALMVLKNGDSLASPDNAFTPFTQVGDTVVISDPTNGIRRTTVLEIDSNLNRIRVVDPFFAAAAGAMPGTIADTHVDFAYLSGRQLGKVNVNTMWDIETWKAVADVQPMNSFTTAVPYISPPAALGTVYTEAQVDRIYRRIYQQRQPGYFYSRRLVGSTGLNGDGEDRPFQGMGTPDISGPAPFIPAQGIGNTFLSDRYQENLNGPTGVQPRYNDMGAPIPGIPLEPLTGFPGDVGDDTTDRFLRTLFEVGNPGEHHPFRRFELLSKVWNNITVRSNTFSVWMTIGFFEYDEATNSLGAEIGQIQGKNTRYRFFSVVDRTTVDSWLKNWNLHNPMDAQSANTASNVFPANISLFMNSSLFPTLDPRQATYPTLNGTNNTMAICNNPNQVQPSIWQLSPAGVGSTNSLLNNTASPNFDINNHNNHWRLVQVESDSGLEIGQIVPPPVAGPAGSFCVRLSVAPVGQSIVVRPLPVPPTVLHWSQIK